MQAPNTEQRSPKGKSSSEQRVYPEGKQTGAEVDSAAPMRKEAPNGKKSLMEAIVSRENMAKAYKQVVANQGSAGVDGMEVGELKAYLNIHWPQIREQLLNGTYKPQALRKVMIPKASGGERMLGIPTVVDRLIQQSIQQVLTPIWEETFSDHSYGFRPGRSAQQAVERARKIQEEGKSVVVDLDLAQFFDEVNHARLMSRVMERTKGDRELHRVLQRYLKTGIMEGGVVSQREKGTPQGSPLSPLLSNIVLDELDKELEHRGHSFVRYADDCNIYVRNTRAGERVMRSVTGYIEKKLRLKVNREKSKVTVPGKSKFLGFSFYRNGQGPRICISKDSIDRLRQKVKEVMRRGRGRSLGKVTEELNPLLRGWTQYYSIADAKNRTEELDQWIRRRMRLLIWIRWKRNWTRKEQLMRRGLPEEQAVQSAFNGRGPWWNSGAPHMNFAFPSSYFEQLGLISLQQRLTSIRRK